MLPRSKDIDMMRALLKRGVVSCGFANVSLTFGSSSHAHTAFLTLTNEKKRNPLSLETIRELHAALTEVAAKAHNSRLKILVLKAEGPVFSAGHDLKELKAAGEPEKIFEEFTQGLLMLKGLPLVTLCAVDGVAAAAGLQLALSCDLLLATARSTFSTPGVKWGLFCSTPGVQLLRSISSEKKAREMLLFGESITAQEALHYGLVNQVVADREGLDGEVEAFIGKAEKLSAQVMALGKEVLGRQAPESLTQAYCTATAGMRENILRKEDCRQGLTAFAKKRHPHFKN